ncbi:hypothetical protein [Salipiger mucosus]|uniref:Uncharacterized protein n=1 Tax=Salipiger mucosus DSM 16094 TaxID=1123237 RepID=S9QWA0_9RHOB|nr:hypothetical protein [Salipiger mucosus]EPX83893.1 hypothetical protein Salmuc_01668 [Salipiger mucosus DSM 16094]
MSMHPKSPVSAYDANGELTSFARESVIRMASNFEISSMLIAANDDMEYDGLLDLVENRGLGLARWDNAKLSDHWDNIKDDYFALLDAGKLVFDHEDPEIVPLECPTTMLKIEGKDGAELQIERNDLIERLVITAAAQAINSWEDFGDTDFIDNAQLEGTTGLHNLTDKELLREWREARNSFYFKAFAGTLKHDIPAADPEHDLLTADVFPGPA